MTKPEKKMQIIRRTLPQGYIGKKRKEETLSRMVERDRVTGELEGVNKVLRQGNV